MYAIGHTNDVADALKEASTLAESFRSKQPSIEEAKQLVGLVSKAAKESMALARILIEGEKMWEEIQKGEPPVLS
jgi:uncharacterized protein Yka (UPF0111/DUF47 family)